MKIMQNDFFWPRMRTYVDSSIRNCFTCSSQRFSSPNITHTWPKEQSPGQRIHMDWGYTKTSGEVLIVVDAFSGWLEAVPCRNRQAATIITCLRRMFSQFGIPTSLVCDNAKEFCDGKLREWLNRVGCRLTH